MFDHCDPSLRITGLPATVEIQPNKRVDIAYEAMPTRRGEIDFAPADLRVRGVLGLCELLERAA